MLHPDKANGQPAHDRMRFPVVFRAMLLVLFLRIVAWPDPSPAGAAVLEKIRMGDHDTYTRLVFEFSAPVHYQLSKDTAAGIVSVRFLETASKVSPVLVSKGPDCIGTVSTRQDGNDTITNIQLDPKEVRLNPFTIQEPDRVVLDISCVEVPVAITAPPEPRDIAPMPVPVAEPLVNEREATPPPVQQAPLLTDPYPQNDHYQKYLLMLLAAITGVIVLFIALIIIQKRSLSEGHLAGDGDATGNSDYMVQAIDTKIKEKLMKYDE
jgi:hypothetical protein